jgi:hypothetical protein
MSAPDLLGILHRMVRYVGIVSDAAIVTVRKHGDAHRLVLTVRPGSRPAPHQRFAFDLLRFLSFCRWVTDTELNPAAVELSHPGGLSATVSRSGRRAPQRTGTSPAGKIAGLLLTGPSDWQRLMSRRSGRSVEAAQATTRFGRLAKHRHRSGLGQKQTPAQSERLRGAAAE